MANVFDVAKHIITNLGPVTAMKLQKLCYYSQAWSLVWEEKPLFDNRIEAWWKGPVIPDLYNRYAGKFIIEYDKSIDALCEGNLTSEEITTIDGVLRTYGRMTAQELSDLTHKEDPWRIANGTCPISSNCDAEITLDMMHEYYSSIPHNSNVF